MEQLRTTPDTLDERRACPLCITLDQVERPLERHLALRVDGLHESWHCRTCHSTFTPPRSNSPGSTSATATTSSCSNSTPSS